MLRSRIPPYLAGAQISATALARSHMLPVDPMRIVLYQVPHTNTHRRRHRNRHRHTQTMEKKRVTKPKKKAQKAKFPNFLKIVKKTAPRSPQKGAPDPPQNKGSGPKNHCKTQGIRPKSGPTPTRIFIDFFAFQPNRPQKRPKIIKNPWFFKEIGPKTVSESYPPLGRI